MTSAHWTFGQVPPGPHSSDEALREGAAFGPYRLQNALGEGATSWVFAASDPVGRRVAIKVLKTGFNKAQRARFQRDGELAARLSHSGVLPIHGGGELGGKPFLVYELVDGARELGAWLIGKPVTERVRCVRDAAVAVGFAHSQGVIHRDLKMANVLIGDDGRVRVADFGLGRAEDSQRLTHTGAILGTPLAMAPEQIGGEVVGPAADVWALGVMLYEALTGQVPFDGSSLLELSVQVAGSDPEFPTRLASDVSPALEAVCLKALRKEIAERYPDAGALALDLDLAIAGDRPEARQAQRPLLFAAAGTALVLLSLTAIWFVLQRRQDPEIQPATAVEKTPAIVETPDLLAQRWQKTQRLRPRERSLSAAFQLLDEPGAAALRSEVQAEPCSRSPGRGEIGPPVSSAGTSLSEESAKSPRSLESLNRSRSRPTARWSPSRRLAGSRSGRSGRCARQRPFHSLRPTWSSRFLPLGLHRSLSARTPLGS